MELGQAGILVSSLASKIMSAASLAKVSGAASGSVLAGLPSLGLTLSSKAALGPAVSTLGSWLGTLNGFNLLGAPAAALTVSPLAAKATAAVVGGASGAALDSGCWPRLSLPQAQSSPASLDLLKSPSLRRVWGMRGPFPQPSPQPSSSPPIALTVGAVPVVLGAMGFTGAGITASSLAAKMMSAAAIANGGGVAAGSLVATLQSVGAAGLSLSSKVILGSTGSALVSLMAPL
ncbi:interferon alpha-inducible protein 27-like protein 2B isoform X1 [Equus asinus]|uniref:Uncharacterized protein n=1 Tax=Equus asinus TaxID=9793 RepID=A0A9L0JVI5_EQUAS